MANKKTIKTIVIESKDLLKTMSYKELIEWGKGSGFDNRQAFSRFKKALLDIGIDFNAKKYEHRDSTNENDKKYFLSNLPKFKITLYSDAKAKNNRFAICNKDGEPIWHGSFFDNCVQEQSAQELGAAKKAIYLADKVFEENNIPHGERLLVLKVDAEWLTWGSTRLDKYAKRGGKAKVLGFMAQKCGIFLKIEHVAGVDNPADEYTICSGYEKWSDNTCFVEIEDVEADFFDFLK